MLRSRKIRDLFEKCINAKVRNDQRTHTDCPLGFPKELLLNSALQKGLADFETEFHHSSFGKLSPDDKALLYSYFHMKGHFDFAESIFRKHRSQCLRVLATTNLPIVVDIGCGPATTALAIADAIPGRPFSYIGVDCAQAMHDLAAELWVTAKQLGIVAAVSKKGFRKSWRELDVAKLRQRANVLLVFSYFFASRKLNNRELRSLVQFVRAVQESDNVDEFVVLVTNSSAQIANRWYQEFVRQLEIESKPVVVDAKKMYELLRLKGTET